MRLAFVAATPRAALGVPLYLLGLGRDPGRRRAGRRAARRRASGARGSVEVALGAGLLLLSVLLAFRELGIWFSDASCGRSCWSPRGGALIWRQSRGPQPAPASPAAEPPRRAAEPERGRAGARARAVVSRTGLGIALVIAAGLVFLQATGALSAARDVVLAVLVAVVVLGVIFAPWIVRLVRSLGERARRADPLAGARRGGRPPARLGAPDAGDGAEAGRRPARGGRARAPPGARAALVAAGAAGARGGAPAWRAALEAAAEEVEASHGAPVEVVAVGDRELDPRAEALVAAAREAMMNAAKFGGGSPVAVYAEVSGERRRRCSCATAARASTRPRCRRTAAACGSRSSGGWSATAGARGSRARRATGTEVELVLEGSMSAPRVVIVDDHELFRAGVRAELEQLVEIAGDAGTRGRGRRADRAHEPDVVLLDVHMPDGGGVEVIRRVAAARARACASWRCRSPTPPRT